MEDFDDPDFIGPLTQEFLEVDDEFYGELSQGFDEASQFFELPLYYQIGSGFENRPGPSSKDGLPFVEGEEDISREDLIGAISLEKLSRSRHEKYKAEEIRFRARIIPDRLPNNLAGNPILATVKSIEILISELMRQCTEDLRPTDLIRFCFQSPNLDKPISTCILPVSELTTEKVLSAVAKVLQSKEEIPLDSDFLIDVTTLRRDVGAGRNRGVFNVEIDRLEKRSVFAIPVDEDNLCCAKAIVFAMAHLKQDKRSMESLRKKNRPALKNQAIELHNGSGVPLGPCGYSEICAFEEYLDVQIVVFSSENLNQVSYKGVKRNQRINLWLHNGHYDVIKSLKGFFGSNFYCEACEKPYDHIENHYCPNACPVCRREECMPGESLRCNNCDRLCRSTDCFNEHKSTKGAQQFSLCDKVYQCRDCTKVILRRNCPKENHKCETIHCISCNQWVVSADHLCYLRKEDPKKSSDKLIFFDFETDQSSGTHIVNFALAQYADGTEHVFKGYTACEEFCSWLFSSKHKGFTAIAHNMKGFDGQFILCWLINQGKAPDIVPNGSKILALTLRGLNIRVIDSFNFLPMGLSELPGCFGLRELKKGYFPHLFNRTENQAYIGKHPGIEYYCPDSMSVEKRKDFSKWYNEHKEEIFDFQKEMLEYCRSDVVILRQCCLEFRRQFLEISDVDPFCYITIASSCMAMYKSKYIQPNTVAMIPIRGYVNGTKFSADSIRWMDYLAANENIFIQHALNEKGEKKIRGISVDGFCETTNTVYQYHGCFYHGCSKCYANDTINQVNGMPMAVLKEKTMKTTTQLRSWGYRVIEKWEHEFEIEKKEDAQLISSLSSHKLQDRLVPREAFFGGRTNAIKLLHEGEAKYVDFTSLYPWVNKYCQYPVGHPAIITKDFKEIENYFGVIKCRVLPPPDLYLPVLPMRSNGKLLFPLCRTCTENMQQTLCTHTDDERAITGTWITEEVKLSVEKGYKVTDIFEIYHFEKSSDTLFKPYIDCLLKIKQECSGWPVECSSSTEKEKYVEKYEQKEGIKLDCSAIMKNPGRRQVAKLGLNSLWGRFGMNCNKGQITYVTSFAAFNKLFSDSTKKIKDVYFPTSEVAAIHWEKEKEFVSQEKSTNIFIAAFTTAWARIKLYREMDKLGRAVLYHDTDSIIYASNGENDPPLGNFLGDFTDELNGDTITSFVSGGPKNYAYRTATGKISCKVRGFSLNFRNSKLINFDAMKSLVRNMDKETTIEIENPTKISRDGKRRKVINKLEKKLYRVVYDKRILKDDFSTLPYGFKEMN